MGTFYGYLVMTTHNLVVVLTTTMQKKKIKKKRNLKTKNEVFFLKQDHYLACRGEQWSHWNQWLGGVGVHHRMP